MPRESMTQLKRIKVNDVINIGSRANSLELMVLEMLPSIVADVVASVNRYWDLE